MANLLIVGGAGFIGSNFVRYWRDRYPDDYLCVIDALTYAGNRANLDGIDRIDFQQGDICDTEAVSSLLRQREIDTIVNFAAETHVDRSIHGPDAFVRTNVVGTHELLKAAKSVWLDQRGRRSHRFHHVSTDEVYGSLLMDDPAFSEDTPYAPNSPYAASKAASDHFVRAYHHTYGLEATMTNCSNNYGPRQFPEKLIPLFLINMLSGKPLPIYGDGGNVRDWLHVRDHCAGIELVLKKGQVGHTYNIGGGLELSNMEVIDGLCRLFDEAFAADSALAERFPDAPPSKGKMSSSLKVRVADRPGHDVRYAIDATKITSELGYSTAIDFEDGLRETIEWYLSNESWWRPLLDRNYQEWVATNYHSKSTELCQV